MNSLDVERDDTITNFLRGFGKTMVQCCGSVSVIICTDPDPSIIKQKKLEKLSLKTDVNVPSKSKKLKKSPYFF